MFVGEGWEGDGGEFAGFEPVNCGGVDGYSFFGGDVGAVFEVVVLAFLFGFEPESGEATKVFLWLGWKKWGWGDE